MTLPVRQVFRKVTTKKPYRLEPYLIVDKTFDLMRNADEFLKAVLGNGVFLPNNKSQQWEVDKEKVESMGHQVVVMNGRELVFPKGE